MSRVGSLRQTFTRSGLARYEIEVSHPELCKYQLIRGEEPQFVTARAAAKAAEWDVAWSKRSAIDAKRKQREGAARDAEAGRALAAERTQEAQAALAAVDRILAHTLDVDDRIDWDQIKDRTPYPVPSPAAPAPPYEPKKKPLPSAPQTTDTAFKPKIGFVDFFSGKRRELRKIEAAQAFDSALASWKKTVAGIEAQYAKASQDHLKALESQKQEHAKAVADWEAGKAAYLADQKASHEAIDQRRQDYLAEDSDAITDYCGMVLDNSRYPDWFSQDYELEYKLSNKILIVDYQLPVPDALPRLSEVKYVASRQDFNEKQISQRQIDQTYDSMLYQVALRTLHELFEADIVDALAGIAFNGWVRSVDRATGQATVGCILSIQVQRAEFLAIDLANVDPKACFKKLKGVAATKLHSLTPVPPLLTMSREDHRFVDSHAVAAGLTEGDNLAAMDWEEFEHLIRELFEQEFAITGAEVRVTQASRDGGVDAVIFDPDPLHGGKTVVQAKRYTNTVGVSAVRDLYGTMINEGANKGILVTTSDYGPDAYGFAKDKPLVLLNGGNLLHLLASHGHIARIDLAEAKLLAAEQA